ncbi:E3 UFM1-protein ligase 1 [Gryganskiella cystojenkinii]|nr:E3 UFM1-protein ligase 1 [Gryganskiella cystojenkinii]
MTNAIWKTLFGPGDSPEDLHGPDKLSEDACGDLVQSLIRLGYISDIVTGADGRTFITHQQLQEDILLQLNKRHGRVSTLELPKALNATLTDIQDRVQELIRLQSSKLVLVQDELVKVEYLDGLTDQLNIELSQRGHLLVAEQCRKYKFGIDFMRQWDILDRGLIVAPWFLEQEKSTLRLIFNGLKEKRGIMDPRGYIQANHPSALLLETHIVDDNIWSMVDASVEDAIANLSWIDVKPLLPTPLTKDDVSSLLRQLPSLAEPTSRITIAPDQDHSLTGLRGGPAQETITLQSSVVVTSGQFQKCLLKMGPLLDRKAKALFSWRLSFGSNDLIEGVSGNTDGLLAGPTSLKNHFENASKASTNARKGTKLKNLVASRDSEVKKQLQDFLTIQDVQEEIRALEPDFDSVLVNAVAGALHQDLLQNLRDRNRSMVLTQAEEEENEQGHGQEEPADAMKDKTTTGIQDIVLLAGRVSLYVKGVYVFEDMSVKNSLSKYLLQTLCVELVDRALFHLARIHSESRTDVSEDAIHARERIHEAALNGSDSSPPLSLSAEDASLLLEFTSPDEQESMQKLRKLTTGSGKYKNLVEFQDVWTKLLKAFTETPVVSNSEQLLKEHLQELHGALSDIAPQSDAALMLHIVTMIVFQSWTGNMLHASGKYVPRILRQLRTSVDQDQSIDSSEQEIRRNQLSQLETMLDHVLSRVKQGSETDLGGPKDDSRLWLEVHTLGLAASSNPRGRS